MKKKVPTKNYENIDKGIFTMFSALRNKYQRKLTKISPEYTENEVPY